MPPPEVVSGARGTITDMDLVLVVLLIVLIGGCVAVATGRIGGGLAPVHDDVVPPLDRALSGANDLDRARFAVVLRGYRMDQVDAVLDEARDLLAAKEQQIEGLRLRLTYAATSTGLADVPGRDPAEPDRTS